MMIWNTDRTPERDKVIVDDKRKTTIIVKKKSVTDII